MAGLPMHLQEIHITQSGPLDNCLLQPGLINLIYGKNESGKSTLLEKTVQTLFSSGKKRDDSYPAGRYPAGNCTVTVELDGKPYRFDGRSDTLQQRAAALGLPAELFPLLLVHSGECRLPGMDVTVSALAEVLFSQDELTFKQVEKRLGKSGNYLEWDGGQLYFSSTKTKDIRGYEERTVQLKKATALRDQFLNLVSDSELVETEKQLQQVARQLTEQQRAACCLAGKLSGELNNKKNLLRRIEEAGVQQLFQQLPGMEQAAEAGSQLAKLQAEQQQCENNKRWLHNAVAFLEHGAGLKRAWLRPAAILLSVLSAAAAFVEPLLTVAFGLGGLGCWILWSTGRRAESGSRSNELQRIKDEFLKRFAVPFTSLTDCRTRIEQLQSETGRLQGRIEQLQHNVNSFAAYCQSVSQLRNQLQIQLPEDPLVAVRQAWNVHSGLRDELGQLQVKLAGLGFDGVEQLPDEECATAYDPVKLQQLQQEKAQLETRQTQLQQRLQPVRDTLMGMTGKSSDQLQDSSGIAQTLEAYIGELQCEQRDFLIEAAADNLLVDYLEYSRNGKTDSVRTVLQQSRLETLFNRFTGINRELLLNGEQIEFKNGTRIETLADLSKGAQDQFLLALRIALLDRLTAGRPLFLLLDDAFQHCDWQRREKLVDNTVSLAVDEGWQILYLTMDDHLKDCFLSRTRQTNVVNL